MAMPMVEVRAAARADLKIIRFPGSIQLRLVGMGMNPDVRQIKTPRGWTIEVKTGQSLAPLGSPKFFTMPDAGMDSITFDGTGTLWRLEVTALEGNNLAPPVITANGRDVEVSFKAQPLPSMEAGSYDLTAPGKRTSLPLMAIVPIAISPTGGAVARLRSGGMSFCARLTRPASIVTRLEEAVAVSIARSSTERSAAVDADAAPPTRTAATFESMP